jgi:hypothetical protein
MGKIATFAPILPRARRLSLSGCENALQPGILSVANILVFSALERFGVKPAGEHAYENKSFSVPRNVANGIMALK